MKVAPVTAEVASDAPATVSAVPSPPKAKPAAAKNKRAEAN
jgi:hypothetical protein